MAKKFNFKLGAEQNKAFTPLNEGQYIGVISKAYMNTSSNNNDQVKLTVNIISDVEGNETQEVEGTEIKLAKRKVFHNVVLLETCIWKLDELFKVAGLGHYVEEKADLDEDILLELLEELKGAEVVIELEQEKRTDENGSPALDDKGNQYIDNKIVKFVMEDEEAPQL